MRILAIETSCDETAVSIIEAAGAFNSGKPVIVSTLGEALLSQVELHAKYGGVYPNLAKREHAKNLVPLLVQALSEARLLSAGEENRLSKEQVGELKELLEREPELFANLVVFLAQAMPPQIDAIAVTYGPGLEPALWVGINFAKALSLVWNIPVIPVNHMEGHMVSSTMQEANGGFLIPPVEFPALSLLVSGGHTELIKMNAWGTYECIGATRDDAAGEAFDKVARMLELPYPGGPAVSRLATAARAGDVPRHFTLPRPMLDSDDYDFSFSGIKTSVLYKVQKHGALSDIEKESLCREFEDAVVEVLLAKTKKAVDEHGIKTVIVGGGVSANEHLRNVFEEVFKKEYPEVALCLPTPKLTTDNATMIAAAGYLRHELGSYPSGEFAASGNLSVAN